MAEGAREAYWILHLLSDLKISSGPILLLNDNTSAIALAQNPCFHERTKHIRKATHFIREAIANGFIVIQYVDTANMVADIMTKPLGRSLFEKHRDALNLKLLPHTDESGFPY